MYKESFSAMLNIKNELKERFKSFENNNLLYLKYKRPSS